VFGWGCLLGYAATGRSAFDGDDAGEGRWSVARPSALDALEEPIRGLVEAALAVDPADRPTTADLVARLDGTGRREAPVPRALPRRQDLDAVPHRTEFTVDEPTTPMAAIMPEPDEPVRALGAPPVRPEPVRDARPSAFSAEAPQTEQADDLVPWQGSELAPAPRRVEYAVQAVQAVNAASAEPPGPPPRRVEYVAEGSRPRRERDYERERRPRRLRTVAMITAPAAMVAVLATVIAMAATGNGRPTPVQQGGAVTPGQGPVDSPQAPEDPSLHSYGPRPASAASARDHSSPPVAGQHPRGRGTQPGTPSRPGGGGHSPSRPPTHKPTPPPTHSPTPSPTPTPTGTGPANTTGGTSTSS
jgi:hypothetical protein